jgi:hypothetical protein
LLPTISNVTVSKFPLRTFVTLRIDPASAQAFRCAGAEDPKAAIDADGDKDEELVSHVMLKASRVGFLHHRIRQ